MVASCDGTHGVVELHVRLEGVGTATRAELRVGEHREEVPVVDDGAGHVIAATVRVPDVARWWPHTHGDQPLYTLGLRVHDVEIDLGNVGFRTVEVERKDGAFTFSLNGAAIFCRGALWVPPDVVTLRASEAALRRSLQLFVDAGMNLVRIGGYMSYEDPLFWDLCDELGILVWQDCMLAGFDPPEEPEFVESVRVEVSQQLGLLQGRPSLALVCSSSETHQQAAMFGLPSERWQSPLLQETIPALVQAVVPGVPCLVSSPTGGDLPFEPGWGVAHYFGVGAYLRPLSDARLAGVRFAAECLAFSNPPEKETVERCFGGSDAAGHHPTWKAGVARDSGTSWDFEDVRDHYVGQVFEVNPFTVRYADPDLYLDYGRAAVSYLMATVLAEWRCAQSTCAGALVLSWQDIRPGGGVGSARLIRHTEGALVRAAPCAGSGGGADDRRRARRPPDPRAQRPPDARHRPAAPHALQHVGRAGRGGGARHRRGRALRTAVERRLASRRIQRRHQRVPLRAPDV